MDLQRQQIYALYKLFIVLYCAVLSSFSLTSLELQAWCSYPGDAVKVLWLSIMLNWERVTVAIFSASEWSHRRRKVWGMQYLYSRPHCHGNYGNPCLITQAEPVAGNTNGQVGQGLGWLWLAKCDTSMPAMGHWLAKLDSIFVNLLHYFITRYYIYHVKHAMKANLSFIIQLQFIILRLCMREELHLPAWVGAVGAAAVCACVRAVGIRRPQQIRPCQKVVGWGDGWVCGWAFWGSLSAGIWRAVVSALRETCPHVRVMVWRRGDTPYWARTMNWKGVVKVSNQQSNVIPFLAHRLLNFIACHECVMVNADHSVYHSLRYSCQCCLLRKLLGYHLCNVSIHHLCASGISKSLVQTIRHYDKKCTRTVNFISSIHIWVCNNWLNFSWTVLKKKKKKH